MCVCVGGGGLLVFNASAAARVGVGDYNRHMPPNHFKSNSQSTTLCVNELNH